MAWSRAQAATWAGSVLGTLLNEVGISAVDQPGQLGETIDEALLQRGVSFGDLDAATIADGDVYALQQVLYAAVLRRVEAGAANRVPISMADPNVSKQRDRILENLRPMIERAEKKAAPFIVADVAGSEWGVGSILLDIYEPECV